MKKKSALYLLRKKAGLSQRELAELCNTSSVHICNLENGNRTINENWLDRLSSALKCTKAELLGEEPEAGLNPEELKLLEDFRALSPDKKENVRLILNALLDKK